MSKGFFIALIFGIAALPVGGFTFGYLSNCEWNENCFWKRYPDKAPSVPAVQAEPQQVAQSDPFGEAVNNAIAAAEAAQTAKIASEWENVSALWNAAIELMKAVPESSENYQIAQQKVVEYQPNLEYAQDNMTKLFGPEKISELGGGLGDSEALFASKYGAGIDQGIWMRYLDDYLLVTFMDGRAKNIQIQFETREPKRLEKVNAVQIAESMMPSDAIREEERPVDKFAHVIRYHSKKLASVMDERFFGDEKPGTFILILEHDENNPNQVFGAIIAPGDNP